MVIGRPLMKGLALSARIESETYVSYWIFIRFLLVYISICESKFATSSIAIFASA